MAACYFVCSCPHVNAFSGYPALYFRADIFRPVYEPVCHVVIFSASPLCFVFQAQKSTGRRVTRTRTRCNRVCAFCHASFFAGERSRTLSAIFAALPVELLRHVLCKVFRLLLYTNPSVAISLYTKSFEKICPALPTSAARVARKHSTATGRFVMPSTETTVQPCSPTQGALSRPPPS